MALRVALALHLHQPGLQRLHPLGDHALVEFDLRFTRAAALAGAAGLAFQVAPAAHQAAAQVLQPGEFHLQLAFVALRPLGEDLEDQRRAVGNRHAQRALQIALLGRRQRLVEDDAFGAVHLHQQLDLVGLAAADEQRRVGRLAAGDDTLDRHVAGAFGQQRQFIQRGVEVLAIAEIDAHQHHTGSAPRAGGRRRCVPRRGVQGGGREGCGAWVAAQAGSVGSLAWKFTGRPGTTVEMACL